MSVVVSQTCDCLSFNLEPLLVFAHYCWLYTQVAGADPGFWSGGPAEFWPQEGGPWAQNLLKIGVFPLKLLENCMIFDKSWGQGGRAPSPPGSAAERGQTHTVFLSSQFGPMGLQWLHSADQRSTSASPESSSPVGLNTASLITEPIEKKLWLDVW